MAIAKAVSTKAAKPTRVSMNPANFTAGGLIDDIDAEITDLVCATYDWNGSAPADTPACAIEFTDPNGQSHTQYYGLGKATDWAADDDGSGFVSVSGKTAIDQTTNLGKFLKSAVEAGLPVELIDDGNLKSLIGLKCHVLQKQEVRAGLVRTGKNADRPFSVLLISKIHELPGQAKGQRQAKASAAVATKAAVSGKANGAASGGVEAGDLDTAITTAVAEALAERDSIPKKELPRIVQAAFMADPKLKSLTNKAITRSNDLKFLQSLGDVGIEFDGALVTKGETFEALNQ